MCLRVSYKKKYEYFLSLKSLKKGVGSGSRSVSQRYGSAEPDPHQNVVDPQHYYKGQKTWKKICYLRTGNTREDERGTGWISMCVSIPHTLVQRQKSYKKNYTKQLNKLKEDTFYTGVENAVWRITWQGGTGTRINSNRAVNMVTGLKSTTYEQRLKVLGLMTLEKRRHLAWFIRLRKLWWAVRHGSYQWTMHWDAQEEQRTH